MTLNLEDKPGWAGPTLPIEVQALILMKKYRSAVAIVAANALRLHKQVEELLEGVEEGGLVAEKLNHDSYFYRLVKKLQENEETFGDASFRMNSARLFEEATDEMEDMITWMAMGLWVFDGAELPDGLLERFEAPADDEDAPTLEQFLVGIPDEEE